MKLFIAIPTYNGILTTSCFESLLRNTHILRDAGHEVMVYFAPSNPYLDMVRNYCVHQFLKTNFTDFLFIDSDVGFDDDAILKLIKYDKDIVAGIYPYKQEEKDYPVKILFDPVTKNCKDEETGLVTAELIPTGFMRIQRRVFDRMVEYFKMKKNKEEGIYHFFAVGQLYLPDDDTWYGEDVYFSKRWRETGGEIFIEPRITFTHTGFKNYKGNYHDFLMGRKVDWDSIVSDCETLDDGVKGWTAKGELAQLKYLASQCKNVVEIGSWKGRSTKELLESCEGTVCAVDHWQGSNGDLCGFLAKQQNVFEEFKKNVGHYKNLKIIRGESTEVAGRFGDREIDMAFIDAGHTYADVKADIDAWLPKCTKYICGHDFAAVFPGVMKAVNEKFDKVNTVDSLWWVAL